MRRIENCCVGCERCTHCGLNRTVCIYCDECGNECGEDLEAYEYEDKEICTECLLAKFKKVIL